MHSWNAWPLFILNSFIYKEHKVDCVGYLWLQLHNVQPSVSCVFSSLVPQTVSLHFNLSQPDDSAPVQSPCRGCLTLTGCPSRLCCSILSSSHSSCPENPQISVKHNHHRLCSSRTRGLTVCNCTSHVVIFAV